MDLKVIQVVGYKNAGKTALVCELVRMLAEEGLRVGTVKRDAHGADPEPEGTDTRRHREAGAGLTALVSDSRTVRMQDRPTPLEDLLSEMRAEGADAVVVEGFKTAPYPKIAMLRDDRDAELLRLPGVVAAAVRSGGLSGESVRSGPGYPVFAVEGFRYGELLAFARDLLAGS